MGHSEHYGEDCGQYMEGDKTSRRLCPQMVGQRSHRRSWDKLAGRQFHPNSRPVLSSLSIFESRKSQRFCFIASMKELLGCRRSKAEGIRGGVQGNGNLLVSLKISLHNTVTMWLAVKLQGQHSKVTQPFFSPGL